MKNRFFIVNSIVAVILVVILPGCRVENEAPVASNVSISGDAQVGAALTGSYTYSDAEGNEERDSIYTWYRCNTSTDEGTEISGETAKTYTLTVTDLKKHIRFAVTPIASKGTSEGIPVKSDAVGPVNILPDDETETAQQVSDWLRYLTVGSSPDAVVEAMLAYHFQGIPGDMIQQIHSRGMEAFYNDEEMKEKVFTFFKSLIDRKTPLMYAAGCYFSRDNTGIGFWEMVEPIEDEYNWEFVDMVLESATQSNYGIAPLVVIQPYALWDQQAAGYSEIEGNKNMFENGDYFVLKENTGPGPAYDIDGYQEFLVALKGHTGLNVYELANEPSSDGSGYRDDAAAYAELIRQTRQTLGDGVILINGGTLDLTPSSNTSSYWETFFDDGGGDYIDYFNIHYNVEEEKSRDNFSVLKEELEVTHDLIEGSGISKIWITEFGSGDGTEEEIAEWHLKRFSFAAARGIVKVFIDLASDSSRGGGGNIYNRAMLYTENFNLEKITARLLFYTVKLMNHTLSGFTTCEELVEGEQYKFRVNGHDVYVLWGDDELPIALQGESLEVIDVYGNKTKLSADELTLTEHPVFAEIEVVPND